ncbi:NAD(P)/FAD-dependent oxidoreductase [Halopiger goleimassiliensis]|uniref:NAD(P)/FAD-dependent oxidoreductase n=1 Tax=Halopiger goleimassiliensis TaxID=1293048 RepID=UPI0006775A84|nr:FAD-dependent oxidoreductase [Halopiger goleimassiliensis]
MHVVVLGAGYAGLTLTRLLETELPDDVDLTLVDRSPDHLVQHELHRVIRRPELADGIAVSLPAVLERATVQVGEVEEIDRAERTVTLSSGTLSYDVAAICLGARTAYYGLENVREHAIPLKSLSDALAIRSRAREVLADDGHVVVGGAGLSGIQVAGELAALVREQGSDASVTLLEQQPAVAPSFPAAFQTATARALEEQGVIVRTDVAVTGAGPTHVAVDSGDRLPSDLFVWTGGIAGTAAVGDRPTVEADLRLDERTFAFGDAVRVVDAEGTAVPASAQAAVRQARTAATNVHRVVDSEDADPSLETFTFDSPGWLVSVGDDAVAYVGGSVLTGRAAKAIKATVGVGYLSAIGARRNAADVAYSELRSD